jgi:hypothetical protein
MLPGRNTAVFASSFEVEPCRLLVVADAIREEDGSCPEACIEELIQEELRQGSRQALPGCGSEELYASGSSSSRGLSLGQQAAGNVAALLLSHVQPHGSERMMRCTGHLTSGVKQDDRSSAAPRDQLNMEGLPWACSEQAMGSQAYPDYKRLSQLNDVLISAHPRGAMLSCQASVYDLGMLGAMCCSEAQRQEDVMRCSGRGRRIPKFRHYVQETCPDLSEESIVALLSSYKFGVRRESLNCCAF